MLNGSGWQARKNRIVEGDRDVSLGEISVGKVGTIEITYGR